ncbi:MAG: hypothetical protein ACQEQV_00225 [Fibrobacterota bacterium]
MEGKISQLAEKLLNEGVKEGEDEKEKIIDSARTEAESIIDQAHKKAAEITDTAKKEADEMKSNAESEIQLAGNQFISTLKQKITGIITYRTVDEPVQSALSDDSVMAEYIKSALANWQGDESSLDLILPESTKAEMEKKLVPALQKELDSKVEIRFSEDLKGGFQIESADAGYKITFSTADFAQFFGEYLRPKIRNILFGE